MKTTICIKALVERQQVNNEMQNALNVKSPLIARNIINDHIGCIHDKQLSH